MAASTVLDALLGPEPPQDWPHEPGAWWTSAAVLAAMTFAFILVAVLATGRHDPGKRRR